MLLESNDRPSFFSRMAKRIISKKWRDNYRTLMILATFLALIAYAGNATPTMSTAIISRNRVTWTKRF